LALAAPAFGSKARADDTVLDIPPLSGVVVDGQAADWGDAGFRVDAWHYRGDPGSVSNFLPTARLAWDEAGLLVRVDVADDTPVEAAADRLWEGDSVELFVADAGCSNRYQVVVAPGTNRAVQAALRHSLFDRRTAALRTRSINPDLAAALHPTGYVWEGRLPWTALGIEPRLGVEFNLQIVVNDSDGNERVRASFHPGDAAADVRSVCRLRFAPTASSAATTALRASYDRELGVRVDVSSSGRVPGLVTVAENDRVLGQALLAGVPARATAIVSLPLPGSAWTYCALTVSIDGTAVGTAVLPDVEPLRRAELERVELRYTPVFSGERLPTFVLEEALWIQGLVGPCRIAARYLDAEYRDVARAEHPGRYGAVVTVTPTLGEPVTRRLTLYRQPTEMQWRPWEWTTLRAELPAELGVSASVVETQRAALAEFLKWQFVDALGKDGNAAVLLAGLAETPTDAPPATRRDSAWERDRRWWYELDRREGRSGYPHRVFLPKDYDQDPAKRWPLLLFLHGAGERGSDLTKLEKHGPPKLALAGTNFPFIVVAPQCPVDAWWFSGALADLLDATQAKYRVDEDRVYCTGLSMGGFGTWSLAAAYPDRLAALAPICGGGDPAEADLIHHIPTWVFHGGKDTVVAVSESERMVAALRATGATPHFTVYPEAGHDSWTEAYNSAALYEWLLAQRRGQGAR
jgi:predicted esterase